MMPALATAVRATHIPNLFVMPAGRSRFNAASLLHSERLPELLRGLRKQFDTIMIDTPPMVNIPDARVMARLADGVIMILRSCPHHARPQRCWPSSASSTTAFQ